MIAWAITTCIVNGLHNFQVGNQNTWLLFIKLVKLVNIITHVLAEMITWLWSFLFLYVIYT